MECRSAARQAGGGVGGDVRLHPRVDQVGARSDLRPFSTAPLIHHASHGDRTVSQRSARPRQPRLGSGSGAGSRWISASPGISMPQASRRRVSSGRRQALDRSRHASDSQIGRDSEPSSTDAARPRRRSAESGTRGREASSCGSAREGADDAGGRSDCDAEVRNVAQNDRVRADDRTASDPDVRAR